MELQLLGMLTRRLWLVYGMGWLLDDVINDDHSSLGVDGLDGLGVVCTLTCEQKVGKHVAVVTNEEGVRHVSQLL